MRLRLTSSLLGLALASLPAVAGAVVAHSPASSAHAALPAAVASPSTSPMTLPSPMPVPSALPSPKISPTASPKASPVATPMASATPVVSPTPSASPMPSASPTTHPFLPAVTSDAHTSADGRVFIENHPSSLVTGAVLSIPAGVNRQQLNDDGVAALMADLILFTPVDFGGVRIPLYQAMDARGATLSYTVEHENVLYSLQVRSPRTAEILRAFAQAVAHPAFDDRHVELARHHLLGQLAIQAQDLPAVGIREFRSAFYRDTQQSWPFSGTPAEVSVIRMAQLRAFHEHAYKRGGSSIALVGAINDRDAAAARIVLDSLSAGASVPTALTGWKPLPPNSTVTGVSQISSPVVVIGFKAPAITSPDFAPMFVLSTILQSALGRDNTTTDQMFRPVQVSYDFLSAPANLAIVVTTPGDSYITAERIVASWIEALNTRILDTTAVEALKSITQGHYFTDSLDPTLEARRIVTLADMGFGADGGNEILRRLYAVTPSDLQRVARQYCASPTLAQVSPMSDQGQ